MVEVLTIGGDYMAWRCSCCRSWLHGFLLEFVQAADFYALASHRVLALIFGVSTSPDWAPV
ncbi:hypothetical protein [Paraburkholderia aspalathi]|uniref:Uncharacterized protein n=1 Tax=Paraburkholderia aspalathi TaxID=1324617 RepID=A0A1I7ERE5_9BURK|nr:hypothetical protein [Paraburkholderia aspalathi]SFU26501.1 hypothetical protein SAMN05192563_105712 [Paraburkholderia aspalathi]